jgi:hypothetical protein
MNMRFFLDTFLLMQQNLVPKWLRAHRNVSARHIPNHSSCPQPQSGHNRHCCRVPAAACGQPVAPVQQRALVPADAITPYYVGSPRDPAAVDELLAQAERSAAAGELVVTADVSGCTLPTIWAQPRPEQIAVSYEFDDTIACAKQISYRAIFVVPGSGMKEHGQWAYSPGPPDIATEAHRPPR